MLIWLLTFGFGFYFATRARIIETAIAQNPTSPHVTQGLNHIGLLYMFAIITLGLFPLFATKFTDNILADIPLILMAATLAKALYHEYNNQIVEANKWLKMAFMGLVISVIAMNLLMPEGAYVFPEQNQVEPLNTR